MACLGLCIPQPCPTHTHTHTHTTTTTPTHTCKCKQTNPAIYTVAICKENYTLVPEVFFGCEETRQERERSGERKPVVAGDADLTIIATIGVTRSD